MLQTILITDLEGFTELTSKLDKTTLEHMMREHTRITHNVLKEHGGKVIKSLGDGFLCIFESLTNAFKAGLKLQEILSELPIKVVLHVGEVMEKDNDAYGLDINIAFRLIEAIKGKCICLTDTVHLILGQKADFVGTFLLKGVPRSVKVYVVGRGTICETDNVKRISSSIWRRFAGFYMDVVIFSSTLGLLSGFGLRQIPVLTGEVPAFRLEFPEGKIETKRGEIKVRTPVGELEAGAGKFVIKSKEKPIIKMEYLKLGGVEMLLFTVYLALFWAFCKGQSPGKWLAQVRVIGRDASYIGLRLAFLRAFVLVLLMIPAGLGVIVPLIISRKLPHDLITGTSVVSADIKVERSDILWS